jgi:hypothetical protein
MTIGRGKLKYSMKILPSVAFSKTTHIDDLGTEPGPPRLEARG